MQEGQRTERGKTGEWVSFTRYKEQVLVRGTLFRERIPLPPSLSPFADEFTLPKQPLSPRDPLVAIMATELLYFPLPQLLCLPDHTPTSTYCRHCLYRKSNELLDRLQVSH